MFPGFLTPVLTQLFFPKPPTTFLTCFSRGERLKYARKKVCLNRVSNSQPPGHESDTLSTEPPRRGTWVLELVMTAWCRPKWILSGIKIYIFRWIGEDSLLSTKLWWINTFCDRDYLLQPSTSYFHQLYRSAIIQASSGRGRQQVTKTTMANTMKITQTHTNYTKEKMTTR